mmetsp:Transcript_27612/g.41584  ORF Transcript_27612/g.41584 Transcript_27612/m.41584 type:complete len:116 (-) Transcript_27612:84-431(-)
MKKHPCRCAQTKESMKQPSSSIIIFICLLTVVSSAFNTSHAGRGQQGISTVTFNSETHYNSKSTLPRKGLKGMTSLSSTIRQKIERVMPVPISPHGYKSRMVAKGAQIRRMRIKY